jgi:two-component system, OmpR family, response regulator RegX3
MSFAVRAPSSKGPRLLPVNPLRPQPPPARPSARFYRPLTVAAAICATIFGVTEPAPRILIVEDEPAIRHGLVELFRSQGYALEVAEDGHAALARLACAQFDLVLLDIMLPGVDGLGVLRQTRARGDLVPVLVLTARGAEADIVAGLDAGADDYVTKPFGIRELLARARGLLRRNRPAPASQSFRVGDALVDLARLAITWPGGQLELTAREGLILDFLRARPGVGVTREELLTQVWGYQDGTVRTRTVDVHILQLRGKLRQLPGGDDWIGTVRGRGYRWDAR